MTIAATIRPDGHQDTPATSTRYRVVSADAHVLEPPHIWERWLPAALQDRAPKLAKDAAGGDGWLFAGASEPDPIGLTATPGMPWDQFRWTGVTYDEARAGCYGGAPRLADMDTDGVDAEILFPPQRTVGHFLGDDDDAFVRAGIDEYIETGVGWIPHFLEQMDDRFWRNRSWIDLPITEPPSTYWYGNMAASFIRDDNGIRNRHEVGVANMMWSTDYPHHGNDWPYSRKVIAETTAGLPAEERDLIVAGNAVRLFRLEGGKP